MMRQRSHRLLTEAETFIASYSSFLSRRLPGVLYIYSRESQECERQ
jgi:hypothetical protein